MKAVCCCGGDVYSAAFFEGVGYISVVFFLSQFGYLVKDQFQK